MLVEQVVNRNVLTAHPGDDVLSAARRLLECRCGVLPVVVVIRVPKTGRDRPGMRRITVST